MRIVKYLIPVLALITVLNSCSKEDPPLPDNLLNFETAQQGISTNDDSTAVKLVLSRPADAATTITIELTPNGVTYGTEFVTTPAAVGNIITVTIPAGESSTTFAVKKSNSIFLSGSESVSLTIKTAGSGPIPGTVNKLKIDFSSIVSEGTTAFTLEGKTPASNYANTVYADLSNNKATLSDRKSWNLAFYCGADFRVVLNHSYQTTVAALDKTDIATVTGEDTTAIPLDLNHDITNAATAALVDSWDGDITKTAFAQVDAIDANNKVYLVSFEGAKAPKSSWYKVKVTRNGDGYKVEYAKVTETTTNSIVVPKNAAYNFSFLSLETKALVNAEPKKTSWDIQWAYSTYNSGLGSPYWFQDFVLLNYLAGAQAAEVMTASVSYSDFDESKISTVTFLGTRDAIGSKWRATSGGTAGVKTDRFYVVKDPLGNVYKLRFVSMGLGSDGGERGKPVIEYKLVKKA